MTPFGKLDVIGVQLDMDEGLIRFYKNDLKIEYEATGILTASVLRSGLFPAVSLHNEADKVTVMGLKQGFAVSQVGTNNIHSV